MTNYEKLLIEIGQACIDWYQDTGMCHICQVDRKGNHDTFIDGLCIVAQAIQEQEQIDNES